jgi:hypothetical protein
VFETVAGERFSLARPAMSAEQEATVKEMLREILEERVGQSGYFAVSQRRKDEIRSNT